MRLLLKLKKKIKKVKGLFKSEILRKEIPTVQIKNTYWIKMKLKKRIKSYENHLKSQKKVCVQIEMLHLKTKNIWGLKEIEMCHKLMIKLKKRNTVETKVHFVLNRT